MRNKGGGKTNGFILRGDDFVIEHSDAADASVQGNFCGERELAVFGDFENKETPGVAFVGLTSVARADEEFVAFGAVAVIECGAGETFGDFALLELVLGDNGEGVFVDEMHGGEVCFHLTVGLKAQVELDGNNGKELALGGVGDSPHDLAEGKGLDVDVSRGVDAGDLEFPSGNHDNGVRECFSVEGMEMRDFVRGDG